MLTRGVYCVAFGDPARACAKRLLPSLRQYLPGVPVALCAATPLGGEDVFIAQPDSDVGGRRAKLKVYELTPPEWDVVLYLDADTVVISSDIQFYFQLLESGWEFVICKDVDHADTLHNFRRSYHFKELEETLAEVSTLHVLQLNGGVWAFRRTPRVETFFAAWLSEWEHHAQKDQGALLRALYRCPLKVYILGNEWNYFPKYTRQSIKPAALLHYPGEARRWSGMIPGRIDSPLAWDSVQRWTQARRRK